MAKNGIMKEQSMQNNIRNILSGTALALVLGLMSVYPAPDASAQATAESNAPGKVSLDLDSSLPSDPAFIPPKKSLAAKTGDDAPNQPIPAPADENNPLLPGNDMITPPARPAANAPILPSDAQPSAPGTKAAPLGAPAPKAAPVITKPEPVNDDSVIPPVSEFVNGNVSPEEDPLPDMVSLGSDEDGKLGDNILNKIDSNLFSKMSTLEKQSALLSLELRREKIRNEIAAIKAQRKKALQEEQAAEEEIQRKKQEWENEQKRKLMVEEQKLKELEIQMEQLRQEKIVKAYKEQMLADKQAWIKNNEKIYKEMAEIENDRTFLLNDFKRKLGNIRSLAAKTVTDAQNAKERHEKDVATLKTQISVLKARLEAELAEKTKTNPFAQLPVEKQIHLNDVYAIMEIVGKGENLAAKLINKNGDRFLVRRGTALQTGHVIDEITETYIRADINGAKDYLYFAAGGILDSEPVSSGVIESVKDAASDAKGKSSSGKSSNKSLVSSPSIPSLGDGMFVR